MAELERFFEELELRDGSGCAKLLVCRVAAKSSEHPVKALSEAETEVRAFNFFPYRGWLKGFGQVARILLLL